MAPVALLRCCIFWSALFAYGAQRRVRASGVALMQRRFPFQACLSPSPISITRATTERGTPCLCPSRKPQRASSCGAADTRHVDAPCAACATAPDAAPALQLTITGAANLAAAQREAAASNSSYEIVRSARSASSQTSGAHAPRCSAQVVNHLSYMDIMVCAAVFGPYSAVARHDLLDWPIVGPVARAWGVVGVVQSEIREKELSASKTAADGAPSAEAAKPSGRAAALAARAALPGSGWALPPVLVFPEGTTAGGGCLVTFRSGAFVGVRSSDAPCARMPSDVAARLPGYARAPGHAALHRAVRLQPVLGGAARHGRALLENDVRMGQTCRRRNPSAAQAERRRTGRRCVYLPKHAHSLFADAASCRNAAHVFAEGVRDEMAAALHWPAVNGWSVREAHALMHEYSHGGGPLSRAAIAAAAGAPVEVQEAESPDAAAASPAVAPLPPLPPASPAALLARRGGGGSGTELFPPAAGGISVAVPGLARTSSSPDSRLRGRCPSPKQVQKQA